MRLLPAFAALVLCAGPVYADEEKDKLSVGHGIICDTPEQALRFVTLRNAGSETSQALLVINREAASPTACGPAIVAFRVEEEVHDSRLLDQRVRVMKVVVRAISNGGQWAPVPDIVQYALVAPEGTEI